MKGGPQPRVSSPAPGRSTLMTSAPRSASVWPAQGPARMRASSRTFRPSSGFKWSLRCGDRRSDRRPQVCRRRRPRATVSNRDLWERLKAGRPPLNHKYSMSISIGYEAEKIYAGGLSKFGEDNGLFDLVARLQGVEQGGNTQAHRLSRYRSL